MAINPMDHLRNMGVQILTTDDNGNKQFEAPMGGRYPLPYVSTFMNRFTSLSRVFRSADEAIIDSRENARFMMNDIGIRECLDSRMRSVSLLNWHIEPEDEKSHSQREFCQLLEKVVRRIKNFTMYREAMQFAIWFGVYGMSHRWGTDVINNSSVWMPKGRHQDDRGWRNVHGDKIVFRMERPNMVPGAYEGQMGIRIGWLDGYGDQRKPGDLVNGRWRVEATDFGLAYFLSPAERRLMLVHKHKPYDAAYEDGLRAGAIYGQGIRSVIYWEWRQKQEVQAFMMEFLERMCGGIQIWKYPQGNQQAEAKVKEAAMNYSSGKEHVLLVPVPIGEAGNQYGVDIVEPGFQGIEAIQHLIKDYFNNRVKRYILGQILSSEAEATGMGSGVAELHLDTLLQIIRADATNHEETLTDELLGTIVKVNVDKKTWHDPGFRPRFVVETEEADIDKKLESVWGGIDRKMRFRQKDVYEMMGMAMPGPDDQLTPEQQDASPKPGSEGEGGKPPKPESMEKPESIKKPGEVDGGEDESARDDNSATNGYASEHVQRYGRHQAFMKPSGWTRKRT